mmetsp:Transcript_33112/g.87569  ORF Transcript_33112/g.87569 Transcript_33112/m.87569 type:complete len:545 (+) Transcript_33112:130-1764(+)
MATILKVESEGEIRRWVFQAPPDYAAVGAALEKLWPACNPSSAKYLDDEGDACTLVAATFSDFLTTASGAADRPVLRLQLPAGNASQGAAAERQAEAAEEKSAEEFSDDDMLNIVLGPWQHVELAEESSIGPSQEEAAPAHPDWPVFGEAAPAHPEEEEKKEASAEAPANRDEEEEEDAVTAAASAEEEEEDEWVGLDLLLQAVQAVAEAASPEENAVGLTEPSQPSTADLTSLKEEDQEAADLTGIDKEGDAVSLEEQGEKVLEGPPAALAEDGEPEELLFEGLPVPESLANAISPLVQGGSQEQSSAEVPIPVETLLSSEDPIVVEVTAETCGVESELLAAQPPASVDEQGEHASPRAADGDDSGAPAEVPAQAAGEAGLGVWEKVSIVLAAFDANGDGHLNFDEVRELLRAAQVFPLLYPAYRHICARLGVDHRMGFSAQDLESLYAAHGNLERDFEAARRKLAATEEDPGTQSQEPAEQAGEAAPEGPQQETHPWFVPLVALAPLVLVAPLLGLPLAAAAAAHLRARRCSRAGGAERRGA